MHIFISHTTEDDAFVKSLRDNLEQHGLTVWIDSRNLRGCFFLNSEIKKAIEDAEAFLLVVSSHTFKSRWMKKEITHALKIKKKRGDDFLVIPLLLDGIEPDSLDWIFDDEILAVNVSSKPGGIANAMPDILAALGLRLPNDPIPELGIDNRPVEDLTLELTNPFIQTKDKITRAAAKLDGSSR